MGIDGKLKLNTFRQNKMHIDCRKNQALTYLQNDV
jgi:hypothetical protein